MSNKDFRTSGVFALSIQVRIELLYEKREFLGIKNWSEPLREIKNTRQNEV